MNILITAPNLDEKENISGISTVVNTIIHNSNHTFIHYRLGKSDKDNFMARLFRLVISLIRFPFFLIGKKIDLIHLNWPLEKPSIYRDSVIFMWAKLFRYRIIVHLHGGKYLMEKSRNRLIHTIILKVLKNADEVIVLSKTESARIKELYGVENCKILPNSVHAGAKFSRPKNKIPVLLFMGRIHESKGIEDIIDAFKILKNNSKFHFVLCGTGPLTEYALIESKKILGKHFTYKGVVKGEDKEKVLHSADVFLLPSRYGEGLPLALLESMAHGIVPVVTDDASIKEVIQDRVNGIFVKKEDPQDLADKIQMILSNKPLADTIARHAHETILKTYHVQSYKEKLEQIYGAIMTVPAQSEMQLGSSIGK